MAIYAAIEAVIKEGRYILMTLNVCRKKANSC